MTIDGCRNCQYRKAGGRTQLQRGGRQGGRLKHYCSHPEAPANSFIGYSYWLGSPLTVTYKRWCPLRKKPEAKV